MPQTRSGYINPLEEEFDPTYGVTIPLPPIVAATQPEGRSRSFFRRSHPTRTGSILEYLRAVRERKAPRTGRPRFGAEEPAINTVASGRPTQGLRPTPVSGLSEAVAPGAKAAQKTPPPARAKPTPVEQARKGLAPVSAEAAPLPPVEGEPPTPIEQVGILGLTKGDRATLLDLGLSLLAQGDKVNNFGEAIGQAGLYTLERQRARETQAQQYGLDERKVKAQEAVTAATVAKTKAEIEDMPRKAANEAKELGLDSRRVKAYEDQVRAQINTIDKNDVKDVLSTTSGAIAVMQDGSVLPLVDLNGDPYDVVDANEARVYNDAYSGALLLGATDDEAAESAGAALKGYRRTKTGAGAPKITKTGEGKFSVDLGGP